MYGKNPVRKFDPHSGETLRVQDIFYTLQGEGPFAGTPAVFIRLAGCNLRCHFCDTDFESNYDDILSLDSIQEKVRTLIGGQEEGRTNLVVLTGGEPMRQRIGPLISRLCGELRLHVQIETAGTLWFPMGDYPNTLIQTTPGKIRSEWYSFVVSPKTGQVHPHFNIYAMAWKYIVAADEIDSEDGLPCMSTQIKGEKCRIARPPKEAKGAIYIQPMSVPDKAEAERNLRTAAEICLLHGYRLSLQQHKIMGLP